MTSRVPTELKFRSEVNVGIYFQTGVIFTFTLETDATLQVQLSSPETRGCTWRVATAPRLDINSEGGWGSGSGLSSRSDKYPSDWVPKLIISESSGVW